eukprot:scaffold107915_cov30-Tisochrysis_lutea.AAC.2
MQNKATSSAPAHLMDAVTPSVGLLSGEGQYVALDHLLHHAVAALSMLPGCPGSDKRPSFAPCDFQ